jgi:hypothetical protein
VESFVEVGAVKKLYVAPPVEVLSGGFKERQDETQFTIKIGVKKKKN